MLLAGDELVIARPDIASINITGSTFDDRPLGHLLPAAQPASMPTRSSRSVIRPPVPVIQAMIFDAYAQTPVVAFNPITSPDGDDDITLITQMTTFLWVDSEAWNTEVTATVALPLPVDPFSVTTRALPRTALWSGGDEPIECDGDDMHPYVFGIGGDDAQPSTCTMVFKQSSAVQEQRLDLEVVWDVSYSCSDGGCGGPLADITTVSTRTVVVGEIQAVET